MVRSLKVIGTFALTLVAGASSLAVPRAPSSSSSVTRTPAANNARNHASLFGSSPTSAPDNGARRRTTPLFGVAARDAVTMMPATVERPPAKTGGGPAVLDRPAVERKQKRSPAKESRSVGNESWEVRIYNDGTNTREFVARCLVQLAGLSEVAAYQTMMTAHQNGIAVVGRYVYERAEMYHEALKSNGIICDLVPVDEES